MNEKKCKWIKLNEESDELDYVLTSRKTGIIVRLFFDENIEQWKMDDWDGYQSVFDSDSLEEAMKIATKRIKEYYQSLYDNYGLFLSSIPTIESNKLYERK